MCEEKIAKNVVIHGHYLDHIIRFLQGIVCHLLTLQVIIKSRPAHFGGSVVFQPMLSDM